MDTKSIRCFEAVYEAKGINQAAKHLFITPQGVSRIISALEEELHVTLFERTKRGMIPTESGIYFYNQCKTLMNTFDQICLNMQELQNKKPLLHIAFASSVLNLFTPELFFPIIQKGDMILADWDEMTNDEVIENILSSKMDIGFAIGTVREPEIYSKEIFHCLVDAIVYPGHPFYERESLSTEDLKNEPLICVNEKFYMYHSLLRRCADFDFTPDIAIKTMDPQLIYRFCHEKMGIGIDVDIHPDIVLTGGLKRIPITDSIPWRICAICRKDRKNDENLRNLYKQLVEIKLRQKSN